MIKIIKKAEERSQDGVLGGREIRVSSQLGHLPGTGGGPWTPKGTGGTPQRPCRMWGVGGEVKGEEKWRPGGGWGRGKDPPRKGEIGEPLGGQRIKRERGQVSPAQLGPQEPAEIPGLILCPPRPPPPARVLRGWEGGKGEQK